MALLFSASLALFTLFACPLCAPFARLTACRALVRWSTPSRQLFFHVSSKKSSKLTDAARFSRLITEALHDMRRIFE